MNTKIATAALALTGALLFTACGDGTSNSHGTSSDAADSSESGDKGPFEIGKTLDVVSFEWDVPYQVTVKSVDFVDEYDGEGITEYVSNADDAIQFLVADTVLKNTGDEDIIPGEYVMPRLGVDMEGAGESFLFDLSEKELSEELAPGEEVALDFVWTHDALTVYDEDGKPRDHADPEGRVFIHFEGLTRDQKSYEVPTEPVS